MEQWLPHLPALAVGPAVWLVLEASRATVRQGEEVLPHPCPSASETVMPAAAMRTAVAAT